MEFDQICSQGIYMAKATRGMSQIEFWLLPNKPNLVNLFVITTLSTPNTRYLEKSY